MDNQTAIIWGTRKISWLQIDQYIACVIGQLKSFGIKPNDRIAIAAPTCPEYIIVLLSLWRMNVVACPVSIRLPGKAIGEYLSQINAKLFLTTTKLKSEWPGVTVRTLILNEVVNFDARRSLSDNKQEWQPDLNQEVTIIATSGSTGQPKAAVHTWGNHFYSAKGSNDIIPVASSDRWLLCLPLYHVAGIAIVVRVFLAKAAIVLETDDELQEIIEKRQVTHASLVATQMQRLLEHPQGIEALTKLKFILLGGSAIPAWVIEQSKKLGLNVFVSYGLTEMSSQVATGKVGGAVNVLNHRQIKIDASGEILVKGETLFKGYVQSGRLHLPLNEDGWFKTGDIGRIENDSLTVLGRMDNMFISGGENIQPEEIEKVLLSLKGIVSAIVIPKEDKEFGARPVAFIEFDKKSDLRVDQIVSFCQDYLPSFKIPMTFYPWPQELVNKGLKVSRRDFIDKMAKR